MDSILYVSQEALMMMMMMTVLRTISTCRLAYRSISTHQGAITISLSAFVWEQHNQS